jgi:hypothetical protein
MDKQYQKLIADKRKYNSYMIYIWKCPLIKACKYIRISGILFVQIEIIPNLVKNKCFTPELLHANKEILGILDKRCGIKMCRDLAGHENFMLKDIRKLTDQLFWYVENPNITEDDFKWILSIETDTEGRTMLCEFAAANNPAITENFAINYICPIVDSVEWFHDNKSLSWEFFKKLCIKYPTLKFIDNVMSHTNITLENILLHEDIFYFNRDHLIGKLRWENIYNEKKRQEIGAQNFIKIDDIIKKKKKYPGILNFYHLLNKKILLDRLKFNDDRKLAEKYQIDEKYIPYINEISYDKLYDCSYITRKVAERIISNDNHRVLNSFTSERIRDSSIRVPNKFLIGQWNLESPNTKAKYIIEQLKQTRSKYTKNYDERENQHRITCIQSILSNPFYMHEEVFPRKLKKTIGRRRNLIRNVMNKHKYLFIEIVVKYISYW